MDTNTAAVLGHLTGGYLASILLKHELQASLERQHFDTSRAACVV